jgi:hypothetical protein
MPRAIPENPAPPARAKPAVREGSAGGDIRIGGDYLGSGETPTAKNLYVDPGVLVKNDGLSSGEATAARKLCAEILGEIHNYRTPQVSPCCR